MLHTTTEPTPADNVCRPALDIYEAAALLRCSHVTVRRMIVAGQLPAGRVGNRWRIRPEALVAFLNGEQP